MERKGTKAMKKAPVLFSEGKSTVAFPEIKIGTKLRIGKLSSRYYQYLHISLDFLNQRLDDLAKLVGLEGSIVEVIGEIRLKEGNTFAIVQKDNGDPLVEGKVRLYADRKKALENHELIFEY